MEKPSFGTALRFWSWLGWVSFGGPAGQIALMQQYVVERYHWVSNSRFMHALNYCMLLPGPEAQQLATYLGWLLHGWRGGLAAGLLFVLPSMLILWALSMVYVLFGTLPAVAALFWGLKPAVVAVVLLAVLKIARKALLTPYHYVVAAAALLAMWVFNAPFPLLVAAALALGWFFSDHFTPLATRKASAAAGGGAGNSQHLPETDYYLHSQQAPTTRFSVQHFAWQTLIALVCGVLPLALVWLLLPAHTPVFWTQLCVFFTKAAFVTFGGAYAVLPYVAQISVQNFGWLTAAQMIDGLALGETTPGPLIMVLAFVGFMAGFTQLGGSLWYASLGLVLTVYYTFLPSFYFIFAGAPLIEQSQAHPRLRTALGVVTAVVLGVVVHLGIFLAQAVVLPHGLQQPNLFAAVWIVVSLWAMHYRHIGMLTWLLVSMLAGLLLWATGMPH